MIQKQLELYEAPITNVLELRSEGMICLSNDPDNFTENFIDDGYELL